ncbi:MAG: L,D-transpeptidase family protein [Patescibacteria group bacterium]
MNKILFCLLTIFFSLFLASSALAFSDNPSNLLAGRILLDKDSLGDLWYVNPDDFHRYYVGTGAEAYKTLKNLSLGISNVDFDKIVGNVPDRLKGKFVIKIQDDGRAFYVDPENNSLTYINNPQSAIYLFKRLATSTDSSSLRDIPIAKVITDDSGREIDRKWQYLGWWGQVNTQRIPIMAEPSLKSKKLGTFSKINHVKVLEIKRNNSLTWYKIDGGGYPGAYVEAKYIDPLPQPTPENVSVLLASVKAGDYWIDVNISRSVLTLFRGDNPILATYVSTGVNSSPTITGIFNIKYKFKKTRMHGAPPAVTHYYDLKDVPWTMYYQGSYAVHGAYWHDEFGGKRSAGCTNLTIGDSKFVFDLSGPSGNADKVKSSNDNPGTIVNNHY